MAKGIPKNVAKSWLVEGRALLAAGSSADAVERLRHGVASPTRWHMVRSVGRDDCGWGMPTRPDTMRPLQPCTRRRWNGSNQSPAS